jgi:molybdopterin-containing oxidoreductase family iron-sulfur binding subunit
MTKLRRKDKQPPVEPGAVPSEQKPAAKLKKKTPMITRRDALTVLGVTAGTALVSQVFISGPLSSDAVQGIGAATHEEDDAGEHQWHMVIDLSVCIGCSYCVRACQAVNDVPEDGMRWNIVFPERTEAGDEFFMNRPCQHCQEAPCTRVCPVGATWKRSDGIVAMDYDRCIGCRYCQVACPYDVRRFNWYQVAAENTYIPAWGSPEIERRPRGVVEKCTFCVQRIDRGLSLGLTPGVDKSVSPACVEICPVGARIFGDALDPQSPVSKYMAEHETFKLREDWGTQPKVHYVSPANGRS